MRRSRGAVGVRKATGSQAKKRAAVPTVKSWIGLMLEVELELVLREIHRQPQFVHVVGDDWLTYGKGRAVLWWLRRAAA